ncbi:LETM1-related biofilm-associated protein [Flavobacterium columnare]|uniref:Letm1 RBD domain-containing protein n=1 Tax=Flavobacterium columnare TaxID=996 RepID=A0AA94EZ00_9FLAO|nr:LETM1-related biofilm-associated protein [Flavobacterium columnare]MCH4831085.1 hypothetical protein [Flavobacterium columnare]MCH4832973.1 hypothetical protein [Flavobacterium columnare]
MINPSAHGWVQKFFFEQSSQEQFNIFDFESFYLATRNTGFLVGYTTHFVTSTPIEIHSLTIEEISKIALLNSLFGVYQIVKKNNDCILFTKEIVTFYQELHPKDSGLFDFFLPNDSLESKLEKIISNRIKTNDNIISKNFSHIVTNALLFIDVLAFKKYIENGFFPKKYLKKIEEIIVNVISLALTTKTTKSVYDDLLQKLFDSSVRYSKFNRINTKTTLENIDFSYLVDDYEKFYLMDLTNMALWNDGKMDESEYQFLKLLNHQLNLSESFISKSIKDMDLFLRLNKQNIPYFNYSNPVKHFYDQTSLNIQTLIQRNKKRLLIELSQSKELVVLLSQSTVRELNPEEKKKIKTQILDICKTIPSLTIFLVPGGSLLLPILIKFIPQLLPSAFNENLDKN